MQGANALLNIVTIPPGASITSQRIVMDGVRGAIFEYASGGPAGMLVSSWAATAGTDPYGNAYPAGFNIGAGSVFAGLNFTINTNGLFFYTGTPALGNLIISLTRVAGTDPSGNAYLQGGTFYQTTPSNLAVGINVASITWYTATGPGGPWNLVDGISLQSSLLSVSNWNILSALSIIAGGGPFISGEGYHSMGLPAGLSGAVRVKRLPWNKISLDVQVSWTATAATTFTMTTNFPDNTYYPVAQKILPMGHNGVEVFTSSHQPARIFVPTVGAMQIIVPATTGGGSGGNSIDYPNN